MTLKDLRREVKAGTLTDEARNGLEAILADPRCIQCRNCIWSATCKRCKDPEAQHPPCGLWENQTSGQRGTAPNPYMTQIVNEVIQCRNPQDEPVMMDKVNRITQSAMDDVWDHLNDAFDHFPLSDHAFLAAGMMQGYQSILPRLSPMELEILNTLLEVSTVQGQFVPCKKRA